MDGFSSNKKILISIAGFVLVVAVLVASLLILNGTDNIKTPATSNNSDNNVDFGNTTVSDIAGTTASKPTDSHVVNNQIDGDEARQIAAYISGTFYMTAEMYNGETVTDINMALSGNDFHATIKIPELSDMELGIMFLHDNVYIVNNKRKKYIDFDSFSSMMGGDAGIDMSMLKDVTSVLDLSAYDFHSFEQVDVDYEGQTANCHKYYANEMSVYFYFVSGELRRIDYIDANGEILTTIAMKEFSPDIPSDMLTLTGMNSVIINETNFMLGFIDFFGQEMFNQFMGNEFSY